MHDADVHAKHLGDQHLHFLLVDALVQVGHLQLHGTVGDDCGGTAATGHRGEATAGVIATTASMAEERRLS